MRDYVFSLWQNNVYDTERSLEQCLFFITLFASTNLSYNLSYNVYLRFHWFCNPLFARPHAYIKAQFGVQIKPIFKWTVLHLALFWKTGLLELGNALLWDIADKTGFAKVSDRVIADFYWFKRNDLCYSVRDRAGTRNCRLILQQQALFAWLHRNLVVLQKLLKFNYILFH